MLDRREAAFLLVLLGAAFLLRAWGTGFGLPHTYHPDEHQYVETAQRVVGGELNPGRFNNPSLYKYALAGIDGVWLLLGRVGGTFGSVADFQSQAAADPTAAYRLGRLVSALFGALTVVLVYFLGRAAYGRREGAAAAVLLAGTYLHVRESHFAVSDAPVTLLVTLALLLGVWILARARRRDYVFGGLTLGLAAATKYSGGVVAVSLLTAHLLAEDSRPRDWPRRLIDRRLFLAAAVAVIAFLLAVPYALLDWPAFYEDVALLIERGRTGFKGLALSQDVGWVFYLKSLWWGMGPLLLLASLAGVVAALVRHRRVDIVLAVFPIALYVYLGRQLLMFARFMLVALPVLTVLAAVVLVWLASRLPAGQRVRDGALAAMVAALLIIPLADALRFDWLLTQPDTRTLAKAWVESNIPEGTKLLVHSNGPELAGGDRAAPDSTRDFDVTFMGTTGLSEEPLSFYVDEGYEYLVLSSHSWDRRLLDPEKDAARRAFYEDLDAELDLVVEFAPVSGERPPFIFADIYGPAADPWRLERPGPVIRVYRTGE